MFDVKKMGEQIARLRMERSYTQEQLAEELKVSPQAVSKWENGKATPEIPMLCEISRFFNCSVDRILDPASCVLRNMDFDYEFLVRPRIPVADYSGPEWPKSISAASFLTAVKLFFGLEQRRDAKGRQINDDEEYILQSAIANICFGYSYAPDQHIHDSFLIYGLDYEIMQRQIIQKMNLLLLPADKLNTVILSLLFLKSIRILFLPSGFPAMARF